MKLFNLLFFSVPLLCQATPAVIVFTDHAHPVHHATPQTRVYEVDVFHRLFITLNSPVKEMTPEQQARVVQHMIQHAAQMLRHSHQGLVLAKKYGIDRYPAIVFDEGRAVVYGTSDVQQALRVYAS